ncbi:MAG: hypothetical protein ACLFP8_08045 [Alphaproteobacteria bacterium]
MFSLIYTRFTRLFTLALLVAGFYSPFANARPVSYPGGVTTMIMNNGDKHSLHLHYSPTAKYSLGYKLEYWRDSEVVINAVQMNNLLKRWNNPDSQANFYLKSGIGTAYSDKGAFDNESDIAAFTGIAADWEDRRYFISYENRYTYAGDITDFYMQSARAGIAPYIGDYGDLHTWLMLEVEHKPESKDKFSVTPMVRLFKDVHLIEAGMSDQGDVLFNWIIRY